MVEEVEEEEEGVVLQEEGCPAVIVEEVPSAQVEECYSAQVLVYDDGTYLMQDVAEEQEVVTEVETGETDGDRPLLAGTRLSSRTRGQETGRRLRLLLNTKQEVKCVSRRS